MRDGAAIPGLPALHYLAMELVTGDTMPAEATQAGPASGSLAGKTF